MVSGLAMMDTRATISIIRLYKSYLYPTCSLIARRRGNHADMRLLDRLARLGIGLLCDRRDRHYMERRMVLAGVRFALAASTYQCRGAPLHRRFDWNDRYN